MCLAGDLNGLYPRTLLAMGQVLGFEGWLEVAHGYWWWCGLDFLECFDILMYICILQCEASKIAKLVHITPMSLWWFMVLITNIVTGAYKPTYNWGASHCRWGSFQNPIAAGRFRRLFRDVLKRRSGTGQWNHCICRVRTCAPMSSGCLMETMGKLLVVQLRNSGMIIGATIWRNELIQHN